ncbi:MAG: hypothetical protein V1913_10410 [Fibrobacterota bacterium]
MVPLTDRFSASLPARLNPLLVIAFQMRGLELDVCGKAHEGDANHWSEKSGYELLELKPLSV